MRAILRGGGVRRARPVGYTHRAVAHSRRTPVVRAVAFILTLWLGLDLAAAGSCCQDEPMHGATQSTWAADCTGSGSPIEPMRSDTCFCCALVVGPAVVHIAPPRQDAVVIPDVDLPDRPGIRPVLYHPPLRRA